MRRDLTSCYRCGTCSVVCPISTRRSRSPQGDDLGQWGMRDRALANPSIWLCHQCATCSAYCPRDARPANVMAALRDYSIAHYAVPSFMGKALGEPEYLPLLFAFPVWSSWWPSRRSAASPRCPERRDRLLKFMPTLYIEVIFNAAAALSVAGGAAGGSGTGVRWVAGGRRQWRLPWSALLPTVSAILRHKGFGECGSVRREPAHDLQGPHAPQPPRRVLRVRGSGGSRRRPWPSASTSSVT